MRVFECLLVLGSPLVSQPLHGPRRLQRRACQLAVPHRRRYARLQRPLRALAVARLLQFGRRCRQPALLLGDPLLDGRAFILNERGKLRIDGLYRRLQGGY